MTNTVLVRTLPLGNGNYGGILQAYAMHRTLWELGRKSVIDVSNSQEGRRGRAFVAKTRVKRALARVGYERPTWLRGLVSAETDAHLHGFVAKEIPTAHLYDKPGVVNRGVLDSVGAFVAGSDQVWRRAYGDVRSFLFDFLPEDDPRPRLSYAASFGLDTLAGYEPELAADTAPLAARLDGLSVRESSAVELVRDAWGVAAEHHVDPTLLLTPAQYRALADRAPDPFPRGRVLDYVLDERPETRAMVARIADSLDAPSTPLMPPTPTSYRQYRHYPPLFRKVSVGAWIGAIADARFVITDSFHGTVFSIIHNVPFVAIVNPSRGATRFESLLETFDLRDRLVTPGSAPSLPYAPIDWEPVNERIRQERERSIDYLRRALGPVVV